MMGKAKVLLLSFNEKLSSDAPSPNYNFLEVFAGKGEVSKYMFDP